MCGIYGSTIRYSEPQLREKLDSMRFRGPDFSDFQILETAGGSLTFGHNRLSIIDLDARSNQPFNYMDKVVIVFNGEIYNFLEVKAKLQKKGYQFQTDSDTEVICAAYIQYKEQCLEHFAGMFSFVLYDKENQHLFGARDRLGKKPFYYSHNGRDFEFSSQLKPISLHRNDFTISDSSISDYLMWNAVPDPKTIYKEVEKLKPGHFFKFELTSGKLDIHEYWNAVNTSIQPYEGSYTEAKLDLQKILGTSVEQRMIADVPLGVFLSGGIDSSLIAALAQKNRDESINTFSIRFNEQGFDESRYAERVAEHLGTDHHTIDCNYEEGLNLIECYTDYFDEPFADASAIPSMLLAKHTRKYVTVALSGDGGDEGFLGYHRYNRIQKGARIFDLPYWIRSMIASALKVVPNYRIKTMGKAFKLENLDRAYLASITNIDHQYIKEDYDFGKVSEVKELFQSSKSLLERVSDFDIKTYLNWDINTKVDRASMAFSLEARAPLMDHRVIEFAQSLPTEFKFGEGVQKRILKDILYEHVPSQFFDRPKSGFTMPFKEWFKTELKSMVLDELSPKELKDIPGINPKVVTTMISQHMRGEWNRYPIIWKLLVLKKWLKQNG